MANIIPNGRLSAVEHGDSKIQIQTEFSYYPQPRIVTSVIVNGMVLHKIENEWKQPIEDQESQRQVEKVINKQHNEVNDLVEEHGSTLLKQSNQSPEENSVENILMQVQQLPAIKTAFFLSADGELIANGKISASHEMLATMIRSMAEFLVGLEKLTSLGDHQDSVISLLDQDLLLVPFRGGFLAVVTRPEVKKKEILVELEKIAEAA